MLLQVIIKAGFVLLGMALGIGGSVLLDRVLDKRLRTVYLSQGEPSPRKQILVSLLRWAVLLGPIVIFFIVMVTLPIVTLRPMFFGAVLGMAFSFFFLVGSTVSPNAEESGAKESRDAEQRP